MTLIDTKELESFNSSFGWTDDRAICTGCGLQKSWVMTQEGIDKMKDSDPDNYSRVLANGGIQQPCPDCQRLEIDKQGIIQRAQASIGSYKQIMDKHYIDKNWNDMRNKDAAIDAKNFCQNYKRGDVFIGYGKNMNDLYTCKNMMIKDLAEQKCYKIKSFSAGTVMEDIRATYSNKIDTLTMLRRYKIPDIIFIDDLEILHEQIVKDRAIDVKGWMQQLLRTYIKDHRSMFLFSCNVDTISMIFGDALSSIGAFKVAV